MELGFGEGLDKCLCRGGHGGLHEYDGIVVERDDYAVLMIVLYNSRFRQEALQQEVCTRRFRSLTYGRRHLLGQLSTSAFRRWVPAYLMEAEIQPVSRIRR